MAYKNIEDARAYQLRWQNARREEFFRGKVCSQCGLGDDSVERLNLHHADPAAKSHNKIWTWAPERRDAELEKCVILCKQCHIDAHRAAHGSQQRYAIYGCRCDLCRARNAVQGRRYRARRAGKTIRWTCATCGWTATQMPASNGWGFHVLDGVRCNGDLTETIEG